MGLEQVFRIRCDGGCESYSDEYDTAYEAFESYKDWGWTQVGTRWYCPDCFEMKEGKDVN